MQIKVRLQIPFIWTSVFCAMFFLFLVWCLFWNVFLELSSLLFFVQSSFLLFWVISAKLDILKKWHDTPIGKVLWTFAEFSPNFLRAFRCRIFFQVFVTKGCQIVDFVLVHVLINLTFHLTGGEELGFILEDILISVTWGYGREEGNVSSVLGEIKKSWSDIARKEG